MGGLNCKKTMSSPLRMLRGRPTAPLPIQYSPNSLQKREEKTSSRPTYSGQPQASSTHSPAQRRELVSSEEVRKYLRFNKDFLEQFLLENVPQEILETVLIRKAQRKISASSLEETLEYETPEALCSAQEYLSCIQQKKLTDTYKQIISLMLESQPDYKTVLQIIDVTVARTLNTDRTALFLVDADGKNLYAQVFSVSEEDEPLVTLDHLETTCFENYLNQLGRKLNVVSYDGSNVAISIDKGVVGYTARTGKLQNVPDAKSHPYFCAEVDEMTGYTTKSLLCAPIVSQGKILGVLEAVNKKDGVFTEADEQTLLSLADFCGLLVTSSRMREDFISTENRLKVAEEILAYHRPCSKEHLQEVKAITLSLKEEQLVQSMTIDTGTLSVDKGVRLVLTMFTDLIDVSHFQFDLDQCLKFSLTVAKNYRNQEYHNWDHAFSVSHCMYWILKGAPERFSDLERLSLFWGCLCHDLDHRGHNNTFLVKSGAPMAKLYSSSILENHHFTQALDLLQLEGHDIFSCLSTEQYKEVLTNMQKAILATDLVRFFANKDQFSKIYSSDKFSWNVPQHKDLVMALMMTTSDLCSSCKPWEKHKMGVMALFAEFHDQGDKEKALGMTPLEMMDRNFKHTLPSSQVGFLRSIACPCSELLHRVLPHVEKLLRNAQNNLEMWEKIAKETATN